MSGKNLLREKWPKTLLLVVYLCPFSTLLNLCISFYFWIMHCCIPTPTTDNNTSTGMTWVTLIMGRSAANHQGMSRDCQGISRYLESGLPDHRPFVDDTSRQEVGQLLFTMWNSCSFRCIDNTDVRGCCRGAVHEEHANAVLGRERRGKTDRSSGIYYPWEWQADNPRSSRRGRHCCRQSCQVCLLLSLSHHYWSLPPTKEDVNVFAHVRLSAWIWMKCCMSTDVGTWTNWLTFEPDPDYS